MTATSLDLSQIRTDALSSAETFRTLIGLGSGDTPTFKGATLSTGTITASTPAVDISQTWNNAAVTFTGSKINIVDTASASGSLLADWQVGGVSRFRFSKNNSLLVGTTSSFAQFHFKPVSGASYLAIQAGSGSTSGIYLGDSSGDFSHRILRQGNDQDFKVIGTMSFFTGGPAVERFSISGAGLAVFTGGLEQRNSTNAQTFRIYNTTDSGIANYERAKLAWESNTFVIGTEIAGTSVTPRNIAFTGGNVGIGTTSPAAKLHITSGGLFVDHDYNSVPVPGGGMLGMYLRGNSGVSPFGFSAAGTGNISVSAPLFYYSWIAATKLGFGSYDGSSANQFIAFDYTSKNIGISTTSPSAKLDISDTTSAGSGSLAASTLNITSTWNTTGTPTLVKCNVVDTSSNAASLLMDLQVGGSSIFSIRKNGYISRGTAFMSLGVDAANTIYFGNPATGVGSLFGFTQQSNIFTVRGNAGIGWSSGANDAVASACDLALWRDAAGTLAQRNSTNVQTFRLYGTYTDASNYERLALSSTTYSSAKYATIAAESAGTGAANINMVVSPKGTGALMLQTPDGTATGGNARGTNAVDLQMSRSGAAQVASGNYSAAFGSGNTVSALNGFAAGMNNTVSGSSQGGNAAFGRGNQVTSPTRPGFAVGQENNVSGDGAFSSGYQNYATGGYSAAIGAFNYASGYASVSLCGNGYSLGDYSTKIGQLCSASSNFSLSTGLESKADRYAMAARASGSFATSGSYVGDAQWAQFVLRIKTTNATATTLMLDGSTTRLTIPSGKVFAFVAKISGIKSDGSAVAFYTRKGCIKNVGGATSLVGSIETIGTDTEDNASTDVAITADDTNDALQINVTGIAAETWRWVAVVEGVEIGYGT